MSGKTTIISSNILSPNLYTNPNLYLNNTAYVVGTDFSLNSLNKFHSNAAIYLKDTISGEGIINWGKINVTDYDLYFNNSIIITGANAVDELANVFIHYPSNVSNIIITGGYINFFNGDNSNQGADGVGLRYYNNNMQYNSNGTWYDITTIQTSLLDELADVEITNVSNNQLLTWNSNNSKWINSNLVIQNDINPKLGSNLNMNNYNLILGDNQYITVLDNTNNHYPVFNVIQTTIPDGGSNFITIQNSPQGFDPTISTGGDDIDIGIKLESKNDGNIIIDTNGGNTYINSTFLELTGFQKNSIFRTSSNSSYIPNSNWSIPINTDTILFDFASGSTHGTYWANVSAGIEGQKLNLIFYSEEPSIVSLIDFGTNKLGSGNGLASKLEMKKTGQGASLIYLGNPQNIWQILNSGAIVK